MPIKKLSTGSSGSSRSATRKPTTPPKPTVVRPRVTRDRGPIAQLGDKVCVELPESALKEAQRGHGGWSMRMKEVVNNII